MTLFTVGASGCASGGRAEEPSSAQPSQVKPTPHDGLAEIVVAGRPVTGSEPSGIAKVPYRRTYTDGELYVSVTGYRSMAFGWSGLEAIYRDLRGTVETTIDPALQRAAAGGLRGREGVAVALDAETGRIRALMNTPSYDPSAITGNASADVAAWKELASRKDQPMYNRALRQLIPPGRTFHVVVAAAALEKGLYATVDTRTRGQDGTGHCANASIRQALRYTCDEVFAGMAAEVGQEAMRSTAEAFGFNEKELLVPVRADAGTYDDGGTKATPLQMARVMAIIANGGKQIGPQLVDKVVHADGNVQKPPAYASAGRQVVKQETAAQLRSALPDRTRGDGWSLAVSRTPNGRLLALAVHTEGTGDDASAVVDSMAKASSG
ncbi:penicillin-binding transpeptidase domain-containing protein [Streptomyces syringium]|uniref:penicillin-binding transpeptidase domain-containing protein n=1 Tax=Streptomyces syringium TaxID=76729 RepID=UPI003AB053CD